MLGCPWTANSCCQVPPATLSTEELLSNATLYSRAGVMTGVVVPGHGTGQSGERPLDRGSPRVHVAGRVALPALGLGHLTL